MNTKDPNETAPKPDDWQLHQELGKEYARQRARRNGKTIRQLVAEANAPKFPRRGKPGRRNKNGKP